MEEVNSDWWIVRTANLKYEGLVPASYLQKIAPHKSDNFDDNENEEVCFFFLNFVNLFIIQNNI